MIEISFTIKPIGFIRSTLVHREAAPHQGFEGAPDAWLEMNPTVVEGLEGIAAGDEMVLITWFHQAASRAIEGTPAPGPEQAPDRCLCDPVSR